MDAQAITLFSAVANAGKVVYDIAQGTARMEEKQRLMDVYNTLMSLKRDAADLEDLNRELKEKLRFRGEDFEFKTPFWYEKKHPERALCAKCYSAEKASPMSEVYEATLSFYRDCLVCGNHVYVDASLRQSYPEFWRTRKLDEIGRTGKTPPQ
jgi:hypothetical protein